MPSSADILEGLTVIANEWRGVAMIWHLFLGAFLLILVSGWRPSRRLTGVLLAAPLASVSVLAWASGNPFNGIAFAALSPALAAVAIRLPALAVRIGSRPLLVMGTLLVGFGWAYPHFLQTEGWISYLYAAWPGLSVDLPASSPTVAWRKVCRFEISRLFSLPPRSR